jgi:hypothetical protein
MTTTPADDRKHADGMAHSIKRRGLLAAAWAAVTGFVLRQTTRPLQASTPALLANTENAGVSNAVVGPSTIFATGSFSSPRSILIADGSLAPLTGALAALHGSVNASGVAPELCGVFGQGAVATGVLGTAIGTGTAVHGIGSEGAVGVKGESTSGNGVRGEIPASSTENAIAIYGVNNSSYLGPNPGAGGFGVYGLCANGHGLVGATATTGGAAIVGATNGVAGAYAGAFYGPVVVSGALTVFGAKSAGVPHPDGTHRRLYCVESPESWFEDFGEAQLECGQADVTIDRDFAAVAALDKYHVFLTGYDGQYDLCVTHRTPTGFYVRTKSGVGDGAFSWRIVAKRKDIPAPRFETVTVPPEPVLPSILNPVVPQPPPDIRQRSRDKRSR